MAGCGSSISSVGGGGNTTATSTTLTASPTTITSSGTTTLTAKVTNASGKAFGTPSGNVVFVVGSTTLGTGVLSANSDGVSSTASLMVAGSSFPNNTGTNNTNAVVAQYDGDDFHTSSNSAPVTITVGTTTPTGIPTTTAIAASPSSIEASATTTLTATVVVTTGTAAPTGQVAFIDKTNGVTVANASLIASSGGNCGSATACSTASAVVNGTSFANGSNSVYAVYQGDQQDVFAGSTSPTITITVGGSSGGTTSTTTTISVSPTTFAYGSCTNFTIQVTGASPDGKIAPTGAVALSVNNQSLGNATVSGYNGTATGTYTACSNNGTALGASGTYTLTGVYQGDANYSMSTSTGVTLTVTGDTKAVTTLTLSVISNPTTIKLGSCGTIQAIPSFRQEPNNALPTGTVDFYLNSSSSTKIGSATLSQGAGYSFANYQLCTGSGDPISSTGTYSLIGVYEGDTNYESSQSPVLSVTVN